MDNKHSAMARHLAAIESGNVTKTNVIGLRKAINHVARLEARYSGNRSNATPQEVRAAMAALERCKPLVRGELHESGVRLLTDKRYRKRLEHVADIIAGLQGFRLVDYDRLGAQCLHSVPVYRATAANGDWFDFRVIPWQSALSLGEESGPTVLRARHGGERDRLAKMRLDWQQGRDWTADPHEGLRQIKRLERKIARESGNA